MSKTNQNPLTKYYSGKFGNDFVLRNNKGKSTLAKLPKPIAVAPTVAQKNVTSKFRLAVNYGKRCIADPELTAFYLSKPEKGTSVYRLAMMDYLKVPVIENFKTDGYKGEAGNIIIVIAIDNFAVAKVDLSIKTADGNLIEEGPCVADAIDTVWTYSATVSVPVTTGIIITAKAYDKAGNIGEDSITL